jgi:large subunit ribosomal protein L21
MYAVIATGGKQYLVQDGDLLKVEKLELEAGKTLELDAMLSFEGDGQPKVGTPTTGGMVTLEVIRQGRAAKISVVKYKAKSRYTRRNGHRQPFTEVKVTKIA